MPGLAIRTRGLVHIYHAEGHDVAALSGVDLDVAAGEMVGLLGPSGSGKSTLMSLLAGIFRPGAGKVFVGGTELSTAPPRALDRLRATEVGLMLQGASRNLLPHATPADNVRFAQQQALRAGRSLADPAEVLSEVGLIDQADEPLAQLTPGGLQLAAVAVAVSTRPGLLLCDEPTSQLDHAARDHVLAALAHVNTTYGTTVVLVTHDPDVARVLPRTVTIRDGRIGGEGRSGDEYAVVTVDGFLPLLGHVRDKLPPGTLVRLDEVGDHIELRAQTDQEER
ncbi:ATP-binding cassette domain-containing protein [Nocardioides cavernae]|uniref:ATP-binding cassette domain-containing protein n=1 Tax=Nocardioides cavernae TaxID=1921566 RepID=A0ABR8NIF3_9ACTN|nr:ATP-binding cassette domain-containing protein [Nocardioides cavernae]MBD3926224.1 ATP-binding cassette domain-containing protein [Nocardioides cavernae]MBM7513816.1 ABC-type lipoprotein export system ATPase subunit [Nocardioides cavernae]